VIADAYTQLVFHVLAHVRLSWPEAGPGDIHDPRYVAWVRAHAETEAAALVADAALLARLWASDPRYDRLHSLAQLHRGWAGFWACADRSLAELDPSEVADPGLLARLRELDGAELIHATMALLGPGFLLVLAKQGPELRAAADATRIWIKRLDPLVPGLGEARIELVWALGVHGRAFPDRLLIGAPVAWSATTPARQAVLAAHEHTVARLGVGDYVLDEWRALTELAAALRTGSPELLAAHHEWLASLELGPLLAEAVARKLVAGELAAQIEAAGEDRGERLSAARAAGSGRSELG
jgi:hypothetical protein